MLRVTYGPWQLKGRTHRETSSNSRCTKVGWKLEDSRRAGAVTQVPSESSHRTRSIAAMTAGSSGLNPSSRRAWASLASTPSLDVDYADSGSCRLHISLSVAKVQRAAD